MAIFYIADLHFGHANIIKYDNRPFRTVTGMNEALIENWNNAVSKNDTVYILGDLCWDKESKWPSLLARLNGNKVLIRGNHDPKHMKAETRKYFQDVKDYKEIDDNGRKVILSHYAMPFHKDDYNERTWMLYEHVHATQEYWYLNNLRKMIKDNYIPNFGFRPCGNFINVGCMMPWIDYVPRTLDYIIEHEHII